MVRLGTKIETFLSLYDPLLKVMLQVSSTIVFFLQ